MGNQLSQVAGRLDVAWTAGDPVSIEFHWPVDNLVGDYVAPVKDKERDGTLIKNLTVLTTWFPPFSGADGYTRFQLTMSEADSAGVAIGYWWWSLTRVGGATLLAGRVNVVDGRQV
jgi:hypothetical protein